jgi:hypothetical protein
MTTVASCRSSRNAARASGDKGKRTYCTALNALRSIRSMSASPSSRLSVTSSGRFIAPFLRCHLPTLQQGRGLRPRQLEQEARALVKDGTPAVGVKRSACVVKLPLMHDGKCQAAPPERRSQRAFPNGPSRGPGARKPPTALPSPILRRLSRPRHALLRGDAANSCCWRAMLACPQGVFGGCAPEGAALK